MCDYTVLLQDKGDDVEIDEARLWPWVGILRASSKSGNHGVCMGSFSIWFASLFFSVFIYSFAGAATVSIPNIGTFEAPGEYTPLSREEIKIPYRRGRPPTFAIGTKNRTTMISYEIRAMTVPAEQLPEVKSTVETTMAQSLPGLVWKKTDIVKMQGRSWLYFEHVSPGPDYDTHNIFLWIPLAAKSLFLNFTCPKDDFPKMKPVFQRSIQSVFLNAP